MGMCVLCGGYMCVCVCCENVVCMHACVCCKEAVCARLYCEVAVWCEDTICMCVL